MKWRNPDATIASGEGEEMKAYYDKERKVWVFPGEDPADNAKELAPPPTSVTATPQAKAAPDPASTSNDPLAAMMAPPQRAPSALRSRSAGIPTPSRFAPGSAPSAMAMGSSNVATPQFAVFKPKPQPEKTATTEESKSGEEENAM